MTMLAKAMSDEEMKQAAEYFASVRWRPHVRVVETNVVPKTQIQGELFIPTGEAGAEPIGNRLENSVKPRSLRIRSPLRQEFQLTWVPLGM